MVIVLLANVFLRAWKCGELFMTSPAMQGVDVVHNAVFQHLCSGFLDRLRVLKCTK